MFRSYLKIALRSLAANKVNTFINVFCLTIGITTVLVILNIIHFELSFDKFHSNADQIYRLIRVSKIEGQLEYRSGVSFPVPAALKSDIPALNNITSVYYLGGAWVDVPIANGMVNKFQEGEGVVLAEPSFFEVFDFKGADFKWIAGNQGNALLEPKSIVLTRSMAVKYFQSMDVLGKTLLLNKQFDCKVTGVVEDLPANTDLPFTLFLSYTTLTEFMGDYLDSWGSVTDGHQCFIDLSPSISTEAMEELIEKSHASHVSVELAEERSYKLQPLGDMHKDARFGNFNNRTVSNERLWALAAIGIFMLLTVCINYINLATAQSSLRSKEIGVRKVLGGERRQLVFQFMCEAFAIAMTAGVISLGAAEIISPVLQSLIGAETTGYLFNPFLLKALLLIVIATAILSGFYPSLVVSGYGSLMAIKNKLSAVPARGISLRKTLVVFQFCITQVFLIGTFVVIEQMNFFNSVDLGFDKEAIVTIEIPESNPAKLKALEDQLLANASISKVSFSSSLPSGLNRPRSFADIRKKESNPQDGVIYEYQFVDPAFIELYNMELVAGRNFLLSDSLKTIINQTLAKNLGFLEPESAIGELLFVGGRHVTVIGVVKDFHSNSLREGMGKIAFFRNPNQYYKASVKLTPSEKGNSFAALQESISRIKKIWTGIYPEFVFDYQFFDENIRAYYREEEKLSALFRIFSVVFILIGCLGLYGLIAFLVNSKMKEVAIRKVFGASIPVIFQFLSKDYFKLVFISFFAAAPIAYYIMNKWLSNFAYHVEISWWMLTLPGLLVLFLAMISVSGQVVKAAWANPVDSLQNE